MSDLKFFHYSQNNSGGYFVKDEEFGVGTDVIIQAENSVKAYEKLQEIGENVNGFNEYCECCGERWGSWCDDSDGELVPSIYSTPITDECQGMFRVACFVHLTDGTFYKHIFKAKD